MNETPAALDAEDKEMLNNLPSSNRRLSCDGAPSWSLLRENTRLACPVQEIPRRRRRRRESRVFSQQRPKPKEEDDDDESARARKQADAREFDRDVASGLITVHRGRHPESFSFEILLTGRSASDSFKYGRGAVSRFVKKPGDVPVIEVEVLRCGPIFEPS
jgi:hypothetical protein